MAASGNGMVKSKKRKKSKSAKNHDSVPPEITPTTDAPVVAMKGGAFDLEDPELPEWLAKSALKSGHYPYDKVMKDIDYEEALPRLQVELVKLQADVNATGKRIVALFEGRDAAGKGGAIFATRQYMNPRTARVVALPSPTEREHGEWYFQRYVSELPTAGEIVLFDRSWYNRAGVERVMGFCTDSEVRSFLVHAPALEKMLVDDGIVLFKFWMNISRETQLKRFHERRHDPLKTWKLSAIDYAAIQKWDAYTEARNKMLAKTHLPETPWTIVLSNDKRRARLEVIRHMLLAVDYRGKDKHAIGKVDPQIINSPDLLKD